MQTEDDIEEQYIKQRQPTVILQFGIRITILSDYKFLIQLTVMGVYDGYTRPQSYAKCP